MSKEPLISVITPMYNAQKYILETIQSVLSQTYKNWEMIIVDNKSTDNSIEIVKSIKDERIKVILLKYNSGGPARPRNVGIENAKGKYIAFLDADDVWLSLKLEKQIKILEDNSDIDIVHSFAYTIDTQSNQTGQFNNQKTLNKLKYVMQPINILYISNYININTVLMRNNSDIKFRENKFLIALEDWAFWIDNKYYGRKEYLINENLINYRVDINSISDRGTDKTYRKAFYLYSILLNEEKISLVRYIFNIFINILKIILKNIK